jgi:3-deoxy-manno-octulosonate cytidylyltransferase (CMP-KDO synthetase)
MKVLGVIPARFASSRFPGKPLIDLKGKSMIHRVYEGVLNSKKIDKVVVATDDQRIVDEVNSFQGNVVLTSELHLSGTDRCGEVALMFPGYDVIVNIQGDEPLVDYRQLDLLIDSFKDESVDIATLGIASVSEDDLNNVNRIKVVVNQKQNALYFSRSCIPNYANFKEDALSFYPFLRHIGLYAYRGQILNDLVGLEPTKIELTESLEQLRWLYYGYSIYVAQTDIETPNIDVPADVEKVLPYL